jgi:hypothetical protein
MNGTLVALFLIATFLGGFTSGLTGFAAGLVVSGIWLHVITPLQTAVLIAAYDMVNQAYGVWKVRRALQWRRILPFVIGGAVGVPLGAYLVTYLNPAYLRIGVGALLIVYSIYNLVRPTFTPIKSNQVQYGNRYRHRRLKRIARRSHRPWRSHQYDLGPARRRAKRCTAGDISACAVPHHDDDHADVRDGRPSLQRRYPQAFPAWLARSVARLVGRCFSIWKTRRCGVSQSHPDLAAGFRIVTGFASVSSLTACPR